MAVGLRGNEEPLFEVGTAGVGGARGGGFEENGGGVTIDDQMEEGIEDIVRRHAVANQFERVQIIGKSDLMGESPEKQLLGGQQQMHGLDPEFQMIGSASQIANPFLSSMA